MSLKLSSKESAHASAVRDMFAGIAGRYDLLNHVLSLNIDKRWRRSVAAELKPVLAKQDALILDVACGTGDLSLELNRNARARIIGTDFCRPMLDVARSKSLSEKQPIAYVEGDAMSLPFDDNKFDAVTIGFGLRNLANLEGGLAELGRILKRGGRLAVLEFSSPIVPGFGPLFNFYFSHILPRIGGVISGSRGAYEYLPDSVSKFPAQRQLAALIEQTGFSDVKYTNLTGGIAALHSGSKAI
ncbi:MAG: bifunctional demethylmenaquinone methyltransferase/2-methoxy-6-polyprenyl-1,4-benzoquinol methylase UbiE [Pyrinomonadaceae bacterium]